VAAGSHYLFAADVAVAKHLFSYTFELVARLNYQASSKPKFQARSKPDERYKSRQHLYRLMYTVSLFREMLALGPWRPKGPKHPTWLASIPYDMAVVIKEEYLFSESLFTSTIQNLPKNS
jgi:hypothetical protein